MHRAIGESAGMISLVNAVLLACVIARLMLVARRYRSLSRRLDLHVCPSRQVTVHQLRDRLKAEGDTGQSHPLIRPRADPELTMPIEDLDWPQAQ